MMYQYFYLPESDAVVRLDTEDGGMWIYSDGQWEENYDHGGIFSGDEKYRRITEEQVKMFA